MGGGGKRWQRLLRVLLMTPATESPPADSPGLRSWPRFVELRIWNVVRRIACDAGNFERTAHGKDARVFLLAQRVDGGTGGKDRLSALGGGGGKRRHRLLRMLLTTPATGIASSGFARFEVATSFFGIENL